MYIEQFNTTAYDISATPYRRKTEHVEITSSSLQLTLVPHKRDDKNSYCY